MSSAKYRQNETNLMNALKKCMEKSDSQKSIETSASPVLNATKKYDQRTESIAADDPMASQLSYIKPKKRQQPKPKQPKKEQTKVEVNIDNVGEAAEWLERGTKDDEDFEREDGYQADLKSSSIRERMQEKAQKLKDGTFRHKTSTTTSLMEKARAIREDNERKRPMVEDTIQQKKLPQILAKKEVSSRQQQAPSRQQQAPSRQQAPGQSSSESVSEDSDEDSKWNKINEQTIKTKKQTQLTKKTEYNQKDLMGFFLSRQMAEQQKAAERDIEDSSKEKEGGMMSFFMCCFSQKNIRKGDYKTRLQLLALSKKQIQTDQDVFLLQHFWKSFKSTPFNRYSSQWPDLGFQGRDPATDLRSTGVLSLLLIYNFSLRHPEYLRKVHCSSIDSAFEFPMAISFIKIAGTFLKLVRKDKIDGKDFESYAQWYRAMCYYTFQQLTKDGGKHVTQFGMAITKLLEEVESSPSIAMNTFKRANVL